MGHDHLQEVEVKLYTPDLSVVEARLREHEAVLKAERVFERNIRYENANSTFRPQGIVLRMRQDHQARLTYKDPARFQNGISERLEAEVVVSDFDTMDLILRKLGFASYMVYEKYRTTYVLDGAEIVLDEMPYGNFAEIEANATIIESLITKLDLRDYPRMAGSYTDLFDIIKRNMGLDFADLTFENFAGLDVPERALFLSK